MKLITERLILRNYKDEDWERVHIYGSNAEFSKYEFWRPNTIEDTKKFVNDMVKQAQSRERFKFDLAICLKDSGLLIGGCGIRKETKNSSIANLGWGINPDFQKKGLATEAATAIINFGLNELNLSVLYATCDIRNVASFRVMEKLGMKNVGEVKIKRPGSAIARDSYRYEIIKN